MSVGESKGGLPPDKVVEDEDVILRDTRRAHRDVSRRDTLCHAARRGRAVLAVHRHART